MKASILTIGDEILIGQIVDTNSVSIARHLNDAGIVVREKSSIGDDRAEIVAGIERALARSEVVVVTGGLGPTTKPSRSMSSGCSRRAASPSTS